jgi:hypothetical protein
VLGGSPELTAAAITEESQVLIHDDLMGALGISHYLMTPDQHSATPADVLEANQHRSDQTVDLLKITDTPTKIDAGFAGLVVNPATSVLNLWWRGSVPEEVLAAIERVDPSVRVVVHPAEYSRIELGNLILASKHLWNGIELAVPKEDGSGVVLLASRASSNLDEVSGSMGVPVAATVEGEQVYSNGTRQDASAPWWGGAMMHRHDLNVPAGFCSTGFAVLSGTTGLLLSAAHCDLSANHRWNNGDISNPTRIAPYDLVWVIPALDSMLLNPDNGTAGKVHVEGYTGSSNKKVSGSAVNNVGDSVATSGANSGEHKSQTIFNDAFTTDCNGWSCTVIAAETGGRNQISNVGGDSGGPVLYNNSSTHVTAKGIIMGALKGWWANCGPSDYSREPGWYVDNDGILRRKCFYRTLYHPVRPVMNSWNVTIETMS